MKCNSVRESHRIVKITTKAGACKYWLQSVYNPWAIFRNIHFKS